MGQHSKLPRLMLVTPDLRVSPDVISRICSNFEVIIQVRDKQATARDFVNFLLNFDPDLLRKWFLINDRVDLGLIFRTKGVHLPESGLPEHNARLLGENMVLGRSVHSAESLSFVDLEKIDYVIAGSVFDTKTHPYARPIGLLELENICKLCGTLPVYAIGGVIPERVGDVMSAGAYGVAVVSYVFDSMDPLSSVKKLLEQIQYHDRGHDKR